MERIPLLDEDETAKMVGTIEMISRPKIPLYPPCSVCGKRAFRVSRFDTNKNRIIFICDECKAKIKVEEPKP
jgi:predicted SprT family Zn-dependent metalloprotease